ncbi:Fe-S oxidoreductase [Dechloromonas denitrificans]|uniref:Fe-S oxidoreductase n=1 Tax=Dechloromonas denitrificans TaxID=281362 RepID=A0A133XI01_9RHOO|nr:(Fe-S)-binding protein [Dechloromonas denitrificans]KXB30573.1 Fe-S oxidoreductase [Dechloromonas denitrificans]
MRVALYVTCLVDLMRPSVGFAALRLLEAAGAEVFVPEGQTCCGQPAWNGGNRALAVDLAKKAIGELEGYDYVVIPSGSCADQIRNVYPQLLADDAHWAPRATALAGRARELTEFLAEVMPLTQMPAEFAGSVTYHDSCKGLRGLGIKQQPRDLLLQVRGLSLQEMPDCEECCGFGGAFSVKYGEVSTQIVDRKCASIATVGADAVVGGDLGCLMNIEGRLRRRGDEKTRVLHIAEVLAGGGGA